MTRKIALYFSGRIKTYEEQLPLLMEMQQTYNIDYFCSINGICDDYHQKFIQDLNIKHSFFEDHEKIFDPSWRDRFHRLPTQNDRDAYKISSSFYNNMKAFDIIKEYEQLHNIQYDIIIKFRADIISNHILPIVNNIETNTIYIPEGYKWDFYHLEGINDHIAYGNSDVMKVYSNVFPNIEKYCIEEHRGYHPESLVLYNLQRHGIKIQRFAYDYGHNNMRHEYKEYGV